MAMATSSAYPPPPPFYRLYKDYEQDASSAPGPPPPIDGTYTIFGPERQINEVLPSLESLGIRELYPKGPNIDFKKELRTVNREVQLHILELADILVERPSQYACRVEDISLIFQDLHHLHNSLRPHQARATLIHMLESQIQRRKQAIEDIKQILLNQLKSATTNELIIQRNRPVHVVFWSFDNHVFSYFRRRDKAQKLLGDSLLSLDGRQTN